MPVPYTFATATTAIPLSQLDNNFATAITLGNTAIQLGNTVTTLNNMTLANVTISSGTVSITNVAVTTANVSGTANISTLVVVGNSTMGGNVSVGGNVSISVNTSVSGNASVTGNVSAAGGSFSSVTSSGDVTLSGGTANGVLYLNGSKVATSGSALTFDGTNTRIGAGVFQSAYRFSNFAGNATAAELRVDTNTGEIRLYGDTNYFQTFYANNSEQMRLTSTGLGIGTSSPAYKLHVQGYVYANSGFTLLSQASGGGSIYEASGNTGIAIGDGINLLRFITNATERARIDSSGNFNVGGTLALGKVYSQTSAAGYAYYAYGNFTSGAEGGIYTGASYLGLNCVSNHALTFATNNTERARISSDGTFNIGTTTGVINDGNLVVAGSIGTGQGTANTVAQINIWETTSGNKAGLWFGAMTNSNVGVIGSRTASGAIAFQTYNSGWAERARIDSSGNLLVGGTSGGSGNSFTVNTNSGNGLYTQISHPNGTGSGVAYEIFYYNGSNIGSITQSGTTAVLYNVTSDQRLKENIVDAPEFGSVIDSIKVRSYDWKSDGSHQRYGFVAQELVTVAPEAVHQPADPEEMMAVDYSKLVPMLVKEIQSLRARVAQLESN